MPVGIRLVIRRMISVSCVFMSLHCNSSKILTSIMCCVMIRTKAIAKNEV
nr:MAG TPA: hypothetical protein [Caudoviricetes sp.]